MPIPVFNPLQNQQITSAMVNLTHSTADVGTGETTTSTSYTDLATSGPAITLSPGVTQDHWISFSAWLSRSATASNSNMSISVAGAAADTGGILRDDNDAVGQPHTAERSRLATTQASGATHTTKYLTGAGTGQWQDRRVLGMAI